LNGFLDKVKLHSSNASPTTDVDEIQTTSQAAATAAVTVWNIYLAVAAETVQAALTRLSETEQARAEQFRIEPARRNYIVAHAALRQILAGCLHCDAAELSFHFGPHGKPALGGDHVGRLHFNLTHSADRALVAVCPESAVGVDVERVRPLPDAMSIARRFFTAAEVEALEQFPPAERHAAFFRLWTRKESLAKATGDGIAESLARFEVSCGPKAVVRRVGGEAGEAAPWTLKSFEPAAGYVAAVAVQSGAASFEFKPFTLLQTSAQA
jgi:4'-phosphopantetheinyl transferase